MEKSKVIRAFTCINSRVYYAVGTTYEADTERISHLAKKGYVVAETKAHIPKAEVTEPHKFALLSHDPSTAPLIKPKPSKRKRNEHK